METKKLYWFTDETCATIEEFYGTETEAMKHADELAAKLKDDVYCNSGEDIVYVAIYDLLADLPTYNIDDILEILDKNDGKRIMAARGASKHDLDLIRSGKEYLDPSCDTWDDRECPYCDTKLDGTSGIALDAWWEKEANVHSIDYAKGYAQNHHNTNVVLLISGNEYSYGDDSKEIIIKDFARFGAKIEGMIQI